MARKLSSTTKLFGLLLVIVGFGMGAGCSQDQGTTSQRQSTAPATQSSTAQPAAVAPQPAAPSTATAPAQSPQTPATSYAPSTSQGDPQNFAQVQVGMTSQQVQQIMGNPARTEQERGQIEWKYYTQQGKFEVYFQNDRVVSTKWH
jgi:hypothetical protein